jgi:hypothetical protein
VRRRRARTRAGLIARRDQLRRRELAARRSATGWAITNHRRIREHRRLTLLLNVLLTARVSIHPRMGFLVLTVPGELELAIGRLDEGLLQSLEDRCGQYGFV